MHGWVSRVAAAFAVSAVLWSTAGARAASLLELNFWLSGPRYDAIVPLCDEPGALSTIQSRFAQKEGRFWNSELQIVGFERKLGADTVRTVRGFGYMLPREPQ